MGDTAHATGTSGGRLVELDTYDIVARLCPVMLAALPVTFVAYLVAAQLGWQPWLGVLTGIAAGYGLSYLVAQVARDLGYGWQQRWIAREGPLPSVAMLRHRDTRLATPLKARYHHLLQANVPDLKLPTVEEEAAAPDAADGQYDAACAWLRARARRDGNSTLLAKHLRSYGFRRNLLGLRALMLALDGAMATAALALIATARWTSLPLPWPALAEAATGAATVAVVHGAVTVLVLRTAWARLGAEAYANSLLETCDTLASAEKQKRTAVLRAGRPRKPGTAIGS